MRWESSDFLMEATLRAVRFTSAACCLMVYPGIVKKVAMGYNSDREAYSGCGYGTHSEMDAFLKLKRNTNSKRISIDVYVIRVNKVGELRSSRPCNKCCKFMKFIAKQRGYCIKRVVYPDEHGNLIRMTFNELCSSSHEYVSSYFLRHNRYRRKSV